ncbi:MAG: glycosyltransferase family 1 protein [Thermoplasmatales archaeon]
MIQPKVIVANVSEKPTSIWLYAENLKMMAPSSISSFYAYHKSGCSKSRINRRIKMMSDAFLKSKFLLRQLITFDYDILHYAHQNIPPILSKSFDKPQVITVHDNPKKLFTDLYSPNSFAGKLAKSFIEKNLRTYMNFENVLATSNYIKNSLISYGFSGNIEMIYLPISPGFKKIRNKIGLRKELNLSIDEKLILSVSTNEKRKNLQLVEGAMKQLDTHYKLVRVGKPIGNSISFSNVSEEMLNKIYNACDALVMPSLEEGLGLPVIEAFATGLPVVASDIEIFHEIGEDAIEYINPMDVESLVEGIKNALKMSDEKIRKGENLAKRFSFQIFKEKMMKYYSSLISNSRSFE